MAVIYYDQSSRCRHQCDSRGRRGRTKSHQPERLRSLQLAGSQLIRPMSTRLGAALCMRFGGSPITLLSHYECRMQGTRWMAATVPQQEIGPPSMTNFERDG